MVSRISRILLIFLGVFGVILTFQNCSPVKFDGGQQAAALFPTEDPSANIGDGGGLPLNNPSADVGDEGPGTNGGDSASNPHPNSSDDVTNPGGHCGSDDATNSLDQSYVCILDGTGKSQVVGYIDSQLLAQNSTPYSVCMSKDACLNIVSKKFPVRGPAYRGYCKKGRAHTVTMSTEQLQEIIDQL